MSIGKKHKGGGLGIGQKMNALRRNNALGQKLGHNLNVGGKIVSNVTRTGATVAGLAGLAMAGTPQGAALMGASKGLLATSIVAGEVGSAGGRMEKKSTRILEKKRLSDLENSGGGNYTS